jgi:RNA polymerase sigma-70 factor (ECF subfamily)
LDLEVAREIAHEAFTRLWERRGQLRPDSNEKAWLMRVAVNLAISHRRTLFARISKRFGEPSLPDPSNLAIHKIEGEHMRAALQNLSRRERAVLALRYGRDLSFAEIGAILDEPEGTVRTIAHRAVQKLRNRLSAWLIDPATEEAHDCDLVTL